MRNYAQGELLNGDINGCQIHFNVFFVLFKKRPIICEEFIQHEMLNY